MTRTLLLKHIEVGQIKIYHYEKNNYISFYNDCFKSEFICMAYYSGK